jgi:NTE family protein
MLKGRGQNLCLYFLREGSMVGKRFKIGLALGGGAARALSHIGILEGLKVHGIPIDLIVGTSMGAIIGAMYASSLDLDALKERMCLYLGSEEFKASKLKSMHEMDLVEGEGVFFKFSRLAQKGLFYGRTMAGRSFLPDAVARRNYAFLLDDIRIEETRIPFAAVALDIVSGEEIVLTRGSLRQAIAATCAIPGILKPVELDERELVDGGWINAVPVEPTFRLGADFVIAVDANPDIAEHERSITAFSVLSRANTISRYALSETQLHKADMVLTPEIGHLHWANFAQAAEAIESGKAAVEAKIGEIKQRIRKKKIKALFGVAGGGG